MYLVFQLDFADEHIAENIATLMTAIISHRNQLPKSKQKSTVNQEIHAALKSYSFSLKMIPRKSSVI